MPTFEDPEDAPTETDAEVVPLALARLERMIESRLSESLSFGLDIEPIVRVKVLDEADQDEDSSEIEMSALPADPEFYEGLAGRILETLEQVVEDGEGVAPEGESVDVDDTLFDPRLTKIDLQGLGLTCDYMVARLRCLKCGHVCSSDSTSHCETFLRREADGTEFRVGSSIDVDLADIPVDFYLWCAPHDDGGPLRVVEGWECPECDEVNWAEIVIRDGVVESIWSIELNRDVLERVHLISSEAVEVAARLTGRPAWTLLADDVLEILLDHI